MAVNGKVLKVLRLIMTAAILAMALPAVAAQNNTPSETVSREDSYPRQRSEQKILGVLIYPGFEVLDVYGPVELWGNLKHVPEGVWKGQKEKVNIRLVTVARQKGDVPSNQGPVTVAEFGYEDAPQLDYLLVPGGVGAVSLLQDKKTMDWIRNQTDRSELVMSVCNGASLLAAAGVLDGRPATTNKMFWENSTRPGPRVKWVKKARWVDDGSIVTSSGISAGMDMSLAVISRLYGSEVSGWLERFAEYDPHRDPEWDPFSEKAGLLD